MPQRIGGFDLTDIRRAAGGGSTKYPFQISVQQDSSGQTYLTVRPGTVNSMLPSNMFDKFYISDTDTWYVALDMDTDGDSITHVELDVDMTYPDSLGASEVGVAPDYFQLIVGIVVNKKSFNVINDSFFVEPRETIRTLRDNPAPGTPYYEINYTWTIL